MLVEWHTPAEIRNLRAPDKPHAKPRIGGAARTILERPDFDELVNRAKAERGNTESIRGSYRMTDASPCPYKHRHFLRANARQLKQNSAGSSTSGSRGKSIRPRSRTTFFIQPICRSLAWATTRFR